MIVFAVAVALSFAAAWTVFPAPSVGTLALAVVAPEWAPYYAALAVTIALVAGSAYRDRIGFAIAAFAGLSIVFALPALVGYPTLVTAADERLRSLAGDRGWPISPYDPLALTGRTGVTIDDDIAVPLRDGKTSLALDLYRPWTRGPHPAVVVVYGGGWEFGDRMQCRPLGIDLARAGYAVVMVDYRHAPQYRYPIEVDDVRDALALVAKEHAAWGIDPSRIAILGRSAGAQIALLIASTRSPVRFAAAVGIYAPIDLVNGYRSPPRPDPANVRRLLRNYLGGPPAGSNEATYVDASPQSHVAGLRAPTLLLTGTSDELVLPRFQRRYAAALTRSGTPNVALELPLANHAFDEVPYGRGVTFERAVLLRFLAATLRART